MIKFKIEGNQYNIPDYVTIDNYSKIYKIKDLFNDDYFAAKLVSIFTTAPIEDLLEADYESISFLASQILESLPKQKDTQFVDRFEIDGVHYGFFPDWKELTFAEYIDMDTISTKKPEELLDLLHILAAIMYRPIIEEKSEHDFKIEKYDINTMKIRAEIFKKKLDVKYILGAQFFFIKFARKYSDYTQTSSTQSLGMWTTIKLIWMMWRMIFKVASKKPLDGSLSSTEFQRMILQSTNTSTKKTSQKS